MHDLCAGGSFVSSILFSLRLAIQVGLVSTLCVVVVGVIIAYVLATFEFRGKMLVDIVCTLPLVLPPSVTGYYLIILCGRNGVIGGWLYAATGWTIMFTWYAAVLASFVVALPLMVRAAHGPADRAAVVAARHHGWRGAGFCPGHGRIWCYAYAGRQYPRSHRYHAVGHLCQCQQRRLVAGACHGADIYPDFSRFSVCR